MNSFMPVQFGSLDVMYKFLGKHNLLKWTNKEVENLNSFIFIKEITFTIKYFSTKKIPSFTELVFTDEFNEESKE